jgi:hypothetical protein
MATNAIVPECRRQHFPPVDAVHLDDATRRTGKQGIEKVRRELEHHLVPGAPKR